MDVNIHPIPMGPVNGYVVQGEGAIMIDGGTPGQADDFLAGLERASIKPEDIQLIVVTHGHWDHIGSAKGIKEVTGAKVAMHQREMDCLRKSVDPPPPPPVTPWGRILVKLISMAASASSIEVPATGVDIVLGDEDLSLVEYGIPGRVIYTPGHTSGSVSVLLETGDAFVGDMAMNGFPLRLSPGLPIFAEDLGQVKASWRTLLEAGAKTVYPGHGKPFSADAIRKALQ
jgi:glyoxylase-like metal-dependent hydrolase (beta-lactamase superfamily II)